MSSAALLMLLASATALAGVTSNSRPEIFLEYSSRQAPIDVSRIRIYLDGEDVTAKAVVKTWRVSYTPAEPLTPGVHKVKVLVYDLFGGAGEKNWTFTIDPNANDAKKPAIRLAPPSPANGAMLPGGAGIVLAVNLDSEGAGGISPESASITVTRNETPVKDLSFTAAREEGKILFMLGELDTSRYTALIYVRDKAGNKSNEELTAFTVDFIPPKIGELKVTPAKAAAEGVITLSAVLDDEPEGNLDTLTARIERNGELVREITSPAVKGENTVGIKVKDIEDILRGKYTFSLSCRDAAGIETASAETASVEIEKPATLLSELAQPPVRGNNDFYISALPRHTRDPRLTVAGKAPADAELVLILNGAPALTETSEPGGEFRFRDVNLSPGENTIAVAARKQGMETAEEIVILETELIAEAQPAAEPETEQPAAEEPPPAEPIAEAQPEEPIAEEPPDTQPEEPITETPPPSAPPIVIPPIDDEPDDEPVVVLNPDDGFAEQPQVTPPVAPPAVEPEIEEPTAEEPPVVEPSEPEPPVEEPETDEPPVVEQPEPPVEPPTEEPPVVEPPEPETPAEEPQIEEPAPEEPAVEEPPVVEEPEPPVEPPVAEEPPSEEPPAEEEPPAAEDPPMEEQPPYVEEPEPPVEETPSDEPAEETQIVINAPKDGHVNRNGRENVNGKGRPDAAVKLFVNGELKAETATNPGGAFSFKDVALAEGVNKIKVVETLDGVELESETITVTFEKEEKEEKEKKNKDDGKEGK